MENSSKALLIAGSILLCILIIAIGMFIYNTSQSTITSSITSMSTQEIEMFNKQFDIYVGIQTGTKISSLMGTLIANANTNKDEPTKIPAVIVEKLRYSSTEIFHANVPPAGDTQDYIDTLGKIKNGVEKKHSYLVEMSYQKNGLIDYITISYDPQNPDNTYSREEGTLPPI